MAYLKNYDKSRFQDIAEADSPTTFRSSELKGEKYFNSPMTNLAHNLSDASIATPTASIVPVKNPRRRLSLSSIEGSPSPQPMFMLSGGLEATKMEESHRLLKTAIKFPGTGSSSRNRLFPRRSSLISNTENCPKPFGDKENCDMEVSISSVHSVSKFVMKQQVSPLRHRQPLEDQDPNSQDSGYGASYSERVDIKAGFRFTEPFSPAPRKQLSELSLMKENSTSSPYKGAGQSLSHQKLLHSRSSSSGCDSLEDGYCDFDDHPLDTGTLPCGLISLLSKPIIRDDVSFHPSAAPRDPEKSRIFRRSLSLADSSTPNNSRVRSFVPRSLDHGSPMQQGEAPSLSEFECSRAFKRPDPDAAISSQSKRRKANSLLSISENTIINEIDKSGFKTQMKFQRSFSAIEATIKTALHRSQDEPDLIGDFTKPYILPLIEGRHRDLKTISSETLATLMNGHYSESVEMFTIVDCRYPYEFEGGHIKGAKNIYTKDQVLNDLVNDMQAEAKRDTSINVKRKHIIVFHCEFSSERGPSLSRFLRNSDRTKNEEFYPALYYPELYLLEGGYKQFYEDNPSMCEPQDYRPMLHPSHETDLKHFRAKTKSWSGDTKNRLALRNLKRLGI